METSGVARDVCTERGVAPAMKANVGETSRERSAMVCIVNRSRKCGAELAELVLFCASSERG